MGEAAIGEDFGGREGMVGSGADGLAAPPPGAPAAADIRLPSTTASARQAKIAGRSVRIMIAGRIALPPPLADEARMKLP
jgi:hypothetical protein